MDKSIERDAPVPSVRSSTGGLTEELDISDIGELITLFSSLNIFKRRWGGNWSVNNPLTDRQYSYSTIRISLEIVCNKVLWPWNHADRITPAIAPALESILFRIRFLQEIIWLGNNDLRWRHSWHSTRCNEFHAVIGAEYRQHKVVSFYLPALIFFQARKI